MKKALLMFGCSITMLASCTQAQSPQANGTNAASAEQVGYALLGPGPINYGLIRDEPDYVYDGEVPRSGFRSTSTKRPDLGDDQEKVREIVELQEGLRPGLVVITGKHVWVNVHHTKESSKQARKQNLKKLQTSLQQGIPRYQVHLRVSGEGGEGS